jgi:hypothetical protein
MQLRGNRPQFGAELPNNSHEPLALPIVSKSALLSDLFKCFTEVLD